MANAGWQEGAEAPGMAMEAGVSGTVHGLLCGGFFWGEGEWKVPVSFGCHHVFFIAAFIGGILSHLPQ